MQHRGYCRRIFSNTWIKIQQWTLKRLFQIFVTEDTLFILFWQLNFIYKILVYHLLIELFIFYAQNIHSYYFENQIIQWSQEGVNFVRFRFIFKTSSCTRSKIISKCLKCFCTRFMTSNYKLFSFFENFSTFITNYLLQLLLIYGTQARICRGKYEWFRIYTLYNSWTKKPTNTLIIFSIITSSRHLDTVKL